jgi:hypothetical protein
MRSRAERSGDHYERGTPAGARPLPQAPARQPMTQQKHTHAGGSNARSSPRDAIRRPLQVARTCGWTPRDPPRVSRHSVDADRQFGRLPHRLCARACAQECPCPGPRLTPWSYFEGRYSTNYEKCNGFDVVTEEVLSQDQNACMSHDHVFTSNDQGLRDV